MAFDLGETLNILIPILAFIFFAAIILGKAKEPLTAFFYWIKDFFGLGIQKIQENNPVDLRGANITYG